MMNRKMARGSLNPLKARMAGKQAAKPAAPTPTPRPDPVIERSIVDRRAANERAQAMSRNAPGGMRSVGTPVGQPRFKDGGMVKADMVSPRKAMAMGMTAGTKKPAKKGKK